MVMPTHSNAEENNRNNVWCDDKFSDDEMTIDGETAYTQWFDLYSFLSQQGLCVIMPSPAEEQGLADHVYAANSGIMIKDTYIVSNFTSEERVAETPIIEKFMKTTGAKVVVCPHKFEGEAELKYIGKKNGKEVYVGGYGMRSSLEAFEWIEKEFDVEIVKIKMTDEKLYHLDCILFPITAPNNLESKKADVMVCTDILSETDIKKLRKYCKIINVPLKLAYYGVTNCVRVGSFVLCGSDFYDIDIEIDGEEVYYTERDKNQFLEDVLADFGMEAVFFNLSEYNKAGACLSCNVCHLNKFSYDVETI